MQKILVVLTMLFLSHAAHAATCPGYPYTLTNGQVAGASQVMANFNTVLTCVNTNSSNSITGPGSSMTNDVAAWADTSGKVLKDIHLRLPLPVTTFYVNFSASLTNPCGAYTCQPGSNSNDCSSPSTPCQTIAYTVAFIANSYDFAGSGINVQLADGAYNECVLLPPYVGQSENDQTVFILGNSSAVANVAVNCTSGSGNAFTAANASQGWVLKNLTVNATNACVQADYHGSIYWDGGAFGSCGIDVSAVGTGAFIEFINDAYSITANATIHAAATDGGEVAWGGVGATITGSPTFSYGLLVTTNKGILEDTNATFTGSFSGPKYALSGTPLVFSTGTTASTANSTQYIGASSISPSAISGILVPTPSNKAVDLFVTTSVPPGAGQSYVFSAVINGSSVLTCTVSGASSTSCNDKTHATSLIPAGSQAYVTLVSSASAAASIMQASVVLQ